MSIFRATGLAREQSNGHCIQLAAHRTVDDFVSDHHAHAADEIAVDTHLGIDSAFEAFFQIRYQARELRGLEGKSYMITDYENNKELGSVRGPIGTLDVQFQKHLLLEAKPR